MMRRFDASDMHSKELRNDLAGIRQKVDTHTILIKHIDLQMAQLSSTVNTRQPSTLPSTTIQKIQKMMGIVWKSPLGVGIKLLTDLCLLV